ncbi:DUF6394 family protein [Hydrogenivirga sp. 128-5-R1-1]|uniref:DUF6394 family protein n=1 Tax=Hydrogenivirga sp. 128-5-R1-1 TaxID=392423 RepID=UPI00015F3A23|nr:DUF6394 family protein [Hydrogenivirga sp. 128-5-R1-1]EDP75038.1 hypothetical protein HG1285_14259 [Hydrogenivirga sp. 128-5-R1-1]
MRYKKIITDFFILMALTTNISFITSPNSYELVVTVATNLAATILKIGEGRVLSTEMLASSLVADLHLIPALFLYHMGDPQEAMGLAQGALAANVISVIISIIETILSAFTEEEE